MRKARWVLGMELNDAGKTPPEGTDAFREDGKWYFWEYLYYCSKCHHWLKEKVDNTMRLIDADALLAEAMADGAYGYVDAKQIADAPTIDAVPVVRCKDCKYYYKDAEDGYGMCDNSEGKDHVTEDGFCYWGKRRDDVI